tara:strand:- start:1013 stop:1213 length:201 start_codon:yes stop_codon:yes gene_type:complete
MKDKTKENEKEDEKVKPNALVITIDLANSIAVYLRKKPHIEVDALIRGLESSQPVTLKSKDGGVES